MQTVNLLKFLNSVHNFYTLDFVKCDREMVNILDIIQEDEQFTPSIDLGLVFVSQLFEDKFLIVDGVNRFVSLLLLLHAICECYKKTTERNDKAIKTIRSKYLVNKNNIPKLNLNEDGELYSKIINGERLSSREKKKPMFILLHTYWSKIKEQNLHASDIFKMLQKINITLVETGDVSVRDVYNSINRQIRKIDQVPLIENLFKDYKVDGMLADIKSDYFIKDSDINLFFKDFLITKFNYSTFNEDNLYDYTQNYFKTMLQYQTPKVLMENIIRSAKLYNDILNINFDNDEISKAFINIKRNNGEDTYAYILNVYDDFCANNISEETFLEILNTINEYLKNRVNTGKTIDFNELVGYLNAFITCK